MTTAHRNFLARFAVCALLVTTAARPAIAGSIPTKSDVVWIGVGVAAIGAGIGVGIFYAVRHGHSLTGCAAAGPSGLDLRSQGDQQTYTLVGDVAGIKPGQRIRVSGKKEKAGAGTGRQFLVEKLSKDYGPCPAAPPTQ